MPLSVPPLAVDEPEGNVVRLRVVYDRPRTRADCLPGGMNEHRPCPYTACKHHLAIDLNRKRTRVIERWDVEQLTSEQPTCTLDVADTGEKTLEEIASAMNLTRERIRVIEEQAIRRLRMRRGELVELKDGPDAK